MDAGKPHRVNENVRDLVKEKKRAEEALDEAMTNFEIQYRVRFGRTRYENL